MRTYLDCIPCFTKQALDALRQVTDDEELTLRALRKMLRAAAQFQLQQSPPEMAQIIHSIVRFETDCQDPYAAIKERSTKVALRLAEEARPLIRSAVDPFKMAVRFSIAGNIMDFALTTKWSQLELNNFIDDTRLQELDDVAVAALKKAAESAESILFIGDNAGEAVFDRLLIEQFAPGKTTYAVKGSPIINDVTRSDATASGLHEVAEIIDNGNDAPGTVLSLCSPAFMKFFNEADLVIAKGQANYESLNEADRELFFLTRVKCPIIARDMGRKQGDWVITQKQAGVLV